MQQMLFNCEGNTMKKLLIVALLPLAACAQPVHRIAPQVTSSAGFAELQCTTLRREHNRLSYELAQASLVQEEAVRRDEMAVLLLGFPITGGGLNREIAELKGQIQAVEQAASAQC